MPARERRRLHTGHGPLTARLVPPLLAGALACAGPVRAQDEPEARATGPSGAWRRSRCTARHRRRRSLGARRRPRRGGRHDPDGRPLRPGSSQGPPPPPGLGFGPARRVVAPRRPLRDDAARDGLRDGGRVPGPQRHGGEPAARAALPSNPALEAERLWGGEVGSLVRRGPAALRLTAFTSEVRTRPGRTPHGARRRDRRARNPVFRQRSFGVLRFLNISVGSPNSPISAGLIWRTRTSRQNAVILKSPAAIRRRIGSRQPGP